MLQLVVGVVRAINPTTKYTNDTKAVGENLFRVLRVFRGSIRVAVKV